MQKKTPLSQCLQSLKNFLARRSHSKKELREKLSRRFDPKLVSEALLQAQARGWLESEEEIAEKILHHLHRKNKSWSFIKNYLLEKGLPLPEYNGEKEREKARQVLIKKFPQNLSFKEKQRAFQLLSRRGFEESMIRGLLFEE